MVRPESKQAVLEELMSMFRGTLLEGHEDVFRKVSKRDLMLLRDALKGLGLEADPSPQRQ